MSTDTEFRPTDGPHERSDRADRADGADEHRDDQPHEDTVEVRRDGPLSGVVGAVAALVAVAYVVRAAGSGSALDWAIAAVVAVVAGVHLAMLFDARAPLMVLDAHGVRLRRGPVWQGAAWSEIDRVEHEPRESILRDGRLTVVTAEDRALSVRLSLSTRLLGANWHELTEAIVELSSGHTEILELVEQPDLGGTELGEVPDVAVALTPTPTPLPERDTVAGRRSEVVHETRTSDVEVHDDVDDEPAVVAVHAVPAAHHVTDELEGGVVAHAATADLAARWDHDEHVTDSMTIVIDEVASAPVADPVIGPELTRARQRLGLSIDQVADRTRVRPHVIEAIEVDDFGPCGGDFYARGHLRTLARILGLDAAPLLADYDERYSSAPIDPRTVFEAELATGLHGPNRGSRGGLNWSVLVAAVMAVVLIWSIARLAMDGPAPLGDQPVLNGSPGGAKASLSSSTSKVEVVFTAATGGAEVIVKDGNQEVVFNASVAFMQTATVDAVPPVTIDTTDGGLQVTIDGTDEGALGKTGTNAKQIYVPERD